MQPDGKRAVSAAATLHKVIDAARKLFDAEGYEAVTMRRIAKAAGVTTGAIFGHYAGKAELYRDVYGHDPITPEQGRRLAAALRRLGNDPTPILQAA